MCIGRTHGGRAGGGIAVISDLSPLPLPGVFMPIAYVNGRWLC